MYKAIVFDWAGVFCSPAEPLSHPRFVETTGLKISQLEQTTKNLQNKYYLGKISSTEFWKTLITKFKLRDVTPNDLITSYLNSYTVYPEMLDWVVQLKQCFNIALLSNLTETMTAHVKQKFDLKYYFNYLWFSNEIKLVKPNPEIYKFILEKLKLDAGQVLFIDDSIINIEAAKEVGFETIHFASSAQCKQEFKLLVDF